MKPTYKFAVRPTKYISPLYETIEDCKKAIDEYINNRNVLGDNNWFFIFELIDNDIIDFTPILLCGNSWVYVDYPK